MTKLLYLDDTHLFAATAVVKNIEINENEKAIILDQTIFYPKGGGQPYDTGIIIGPNGEAKIGQVFLTAEGEVLHIVESSDGDLKTGDLVELKIDQDRRLTNAKIHSAGHAIDMVMLEVPEGQTLKAIKGCHIPGQSFVEYDGEVDDPQGLKEKLEPLWEDLIKKDQKIIAENLAPDEAAKKGVIAPEGKSARWVYFEGQKDLGCGCGGTHISSTGGLTGITLKKISSKKGVTRVSYV